MTNQHVLIWSPYQGKPGEKQIIEIVAGTLKEALDHCRDNQRKWRKKYGEGQAIVATIASYMGLHG